MDDLQRLVSIEDIRRLKTRYWNGFDFKGPSGRCDGVAPESQPPMRRLGATAQPPAGFTSRLVRDVGETDHAEEAMHHVIIATKLSRITLGV